MIANSHLVEHRRARESRLDIRVVDVAGELGLHLDILVDAVLAQALVAFAQIFAVKGIGIKIDFADEGCNLGRYPHWSFFLVSLRRV